MSVEMFGVGPWRHIPFVSFVVPKLSQAIDPTILTADEREGRRTPLVVPLRPRR